MWQIKIIDWFSAGHQLRGYQGRCEALHGHNFRVEVVVEGEELDKCGLLIDFKELKKFLSQILEELDHTHLNQLPPFEQENPSSENLAKYIFEKLSALLPSMVNLKEVWVWESEKAGAGYFHS